VFLKIYKGVFIASIMSFKNIHKHRAFPYAVGAFILLVIILVALRVSAPTVANGDTITVWYKGMYSNGTVFDTNIKTEAQKLGVSLEGKTFEPFSFTVGKGDVIPGFDAAVLGMRAGQKKTFTVLPADGYGEKDQGLIFTFPRNVSLQQLSTIDFQLFQQLFPKQIPVVGKTYLTNNPPWPLEVLSVENGSIKLFHHADLGQNFTLAGYSWLSEVLKIDNRTLFLRQNPHLGDIFVVPTSDGNYQSGEVADLTDDSYRVDMNRPLAGKTLVFEIQIVNIQKNPPTTLVKK